MADDLKDAEDVEHDTENNSVKSPETEIESIYLANIGDQVAKTDGLGFEPYVNAIDKFLTDPNTEAPLSLSIEGEWGSGKSSFMAQLEESLSHDLLVNDKLIHKKQFTVSFNAWRHDNEDSLWAAFALKFIDDLSKKSLLRKWIGHIKLFISRLNWKNLEVPRTLFIWVSFILINALVLVLLISKGPDWVISFSKIYIGSDYQTILNWVVSLGGGSAYMGVVLSLMVKLKNTVGSPFGVDFSKYFNAPDYAGRVDFIEKFHKDFENIVKAYAGKNNVYVFIDDLDRCEVPKAADLMQAINLMISYDPHLIFIIGMDREKVAASIAVKHEKLLLYLPSAESESFDRSRQGLKYGYAFIEKFIQVPFLVPKPTKDDFEKLLEEISKNTKKSDTILDQLKNTLNKIKTHPKRRAPGHLEGSNIKDENLKSKSYIAGEARIEGKKTREEEETKIEEKRQAIILELNRDSKRIKDIILMVIPALDSNPRRFKQFTNLFRLRIYIAVQTDLLHITEDPPDGEHVTPEQLGKFVAISLNWPLLLNDLDADRSLLARLEEAAIDRELKEDNHWRKEKKLMVLLRAGIVDDNDIQIDPENKHKYSLSKLNLDKLLQVSPQVTQPEPDAGKSLHNSPDIDMEFTTIEAGKFMMGSPDDEEGRYNDEGPAHEVTIGKPFELGTYPVTQREWKAVMGSNPSRFKGDDLPVDDVSWNDVQKFIKRLNDHEGTDQYRLPSEAEWEYACRAGTTTRYSFGNDERELGKYAWYADNSDGKTHPAGYRKPNPWGLHDMHGNVWEWVQDKWHDNYDGAPSDGSVWESGSGSYRVRRGGGWVRNAQACRSAVRGDRDPGYRVEVVGFRLLREL